ncbi:hypothetical protein CWE12_08595 [Aliidiomarina sedimenti]|uniref:Capsule polysaccharide biosynthesis protein n=1 Tax=Aliidiomarina sedimenti TaxID=1933879 RepID=A0ABY0BZ23_9GAMM|nr:hypothetical protein [Aliidiomarina sedimenti]RUO30009.1 hypothetical protein CWE12_08595 [Aliidiomarina sedimenti]
MKTITYFTKENDDLLLELSNVGYEIVFNYGISSNFAKRSIEQRHILSEASGESVEIGRTAVQQRGSVKSKARIFEFLKHFSRHSESHWKREGYSSSRPRVELFDWYKDTYWILYDYYRSIVIRENVERIFFNRVPHMGFDTVLNDVAEDLSVPKLIFHQSLFPDRFFYGRTVEELFSTENKARVSDPIEIKELNLFYMKKRPQKKNFDKIKELASAKKNHIFKGIKPHRLSSFVYALALPKSDFIGQAVFLDLKKWRYDKLTKNGMATKKAIPKHFVYFPLHLEPEATTSALGGDWDDQVSAIESLSHSLPLDVSIVIKENPKQTWLYRNENFYLRLKRLPNVLWSDSAADSKKLIRESIFVATITGTAGYEALLEKKPVLFFGNAWYGNIPGAKKYESGIDLLKYMDFEVDIDLVKKEVNNIISRCGTGLVYAPYKPISQMKNEEANKITAKSILEIDELILGGENC